MKIRIGLLLFIFLFSVSPALAQNDVDDYTWWNERHGWQEGDPGWRNWMKITPGYLGPNALPVPPVKKGILQGKTTWEIITSGHFHPGDPTQDLSGHLTIPFANKKIAIEMYGMILERYAFSESIRDERFARDKDGKGYSVGDFYFSTLVQVSKNRRFPNTLFRFTAKTASGGQLKAARHSDSPGYFFDFSFSKVQGDIQNGLFRPFGLVGFYSWQTNDENNLQNDALLYALGADFEKQNWLFSASWSGYSGYKNRRDRPMQLNFDLQKSFGANALRVQYHHSVREWGYQTVRFSYIREIKPGGRDFLF